MLASMATRFTLTSWWLTVPMPVILALYFMWPVPKSPEPTARAIPPAEEFHPAIYQPTPPYMTQKVNTFVVQRSGSLPSHTFRHPGHVFHSGTLQAGVRVPTATLLSTSSGSNPVRPSKSSDQLFAYQDTSARWLELLHGLSSVHLAPTMKMVREHLARYSFQATEQPSETDP